MKKIIELTIEEIKTALADYLSGLLDNKVVLANQIEKFTYIGDSNNIVQIHLIENR